MKNVFSLSVRISPNGSINENTCAVSFNQSKHPITIVGVYKIIPDYPSYEFYKKVDGVDDPLGVETLTLINHNGKNFYVTETITNILNKINACCGADVCNDAGCPTGRELDDYDVISDVKFSYIGSIFSVTVDSQLSIINGAVVTSQGDITLNGETLPYVIGVAVNFDLSIADEILIGSVVSDNGATVQFEVEVSSGTILTHTARVENTISYDLDCGLYPYYNLVANSRLEIDANSEASAQAMMLLGGVTKADSNTSGEGYIQVGFTEELIITSSTITFSVTTYNFNNLDSISIISTKCK